MKTRLIALIMCFVFPAVSFADGKIASIKEGQKAPYTGLLLDPTAFAKIEADKQAIIEKCELDKKLLLERCEVEKKYLDELCLIEKEKNQKTYELVLKGKDIDIKRLNDFIKDNPPTNKGLWFGLGTAAGVVVGFTAVYLVKKI